MTEAKRASLTRAALLAATATFVAITWVSMRLYPGGTSWDPSAHGHRFWTNFLCDLARPTALDGTPNPLGSALARVGMMALALGLLPFFALLARLAPRQRRLASATRALGTIAVFGAFAVTLLPGDRFGRLHGYACVAAAVPGISAALLGLVALLRDDAAPRAVAWVGAAAVIVAAVDFALYLPDVLGLFPAVVAVAVLERLSVGLLLAWMLVCCAACRTS